MIGLLDCHTHMIAGSNAKNYFVSNSIPILYCGFTVFGMVVSLGVAAAVGKSRNLLTLVSNRGSTSIGQREYLPLVSLSSTCPQNVVLVVARHGYPEPSSPFSINTQVTGKRRPMQVQLQLDCSTPKLPRDLSKNMGGTLIGGRTKTVLTPTLPQSTRTTAKTGCRTRKLREGMNIIAKSEL